MKKKIIGVLAGSILLLLAGCQKKTVSPLGESFEKGAYWDIVKAGETAAGKGLNDRLIFGMSQYFCGLYEDAEKTMTGILKDHPDCEKALQYRGLCRYEKGEYEKAGEDMEEGLLACDWHVGRREYSMLSYLAECYKRQGLNEKEEDARTRLVALHINEPYNKIRLAGLYLLEGKTEEGFSLMDETLKANEDQISLYSTAFLALAEAGKEEKAEEVLTKALSLTGRSSEEKLERGKIFFLQEKYREALAEFYAILEEGNIETVIYAGQCCEALGDHEEAIRIYIEALKKANNPRLCNLLALSYTKNNQINEAWQVIARAIEQFPEYPRTDQLIWNEVILLELQEKYTLAKNKLESLLKSQGYLSDRQQAEWDYLTMMTK